MKRLMNSIVAVGVLGLSSAVSASPVTHWSYVADMAFDPFETVFRLGNGETINTPYEIAWGVPVDTRQSSIHVSGVPTSGQLATDFDRVILPSEIAELATVTHENWVIKNGSDKLKSTVVFTSLTLTPLVPAELGLPSFLGRTEVRFEETPNDAVCADPTSPPKRCKDIFVLSGDLLPRSFALDGYEYSIHVTILDGTLGPLADPVCEAASAEEGCVGFTTEERKKNLVAFALSIFAQPIPEPATAVLALFGALVVFAGRRRH